ncbi:MAG: hypothetical protein U1E83_06570 [Methylotetracoccus sp.]
MYGSPKRSEGEAICGRLIAEMHKLGFHDESLSGSLPRYEEAVFTTERDPYSGDDTLVASWRDLHGRRVGCLKFHGDGTFFAEYDLVRPHPRDPRWFVEGVVAWGKGAMIKSEPRLLPIPG